MNAYEIDITAAQLTTVHVVARRLWPWPVRKAVTAHNKKYHSGRPTAHIDPDPASMRGLPRYCAWCPICEKQILDN